MDLERLKQARDVFGEAYESSPIDAPRLLPHIPVLGVVLEDLRVMGSTPTEQERTYEFLTGRKAFHSTQDLAQIVFRRGIGSMSGLFDNAHESIRKGRTLDGASRYGVESAYRMLDFVVKHEEALKAIRDADEGIVAKYAPGF
ncbi:MAG: hypothetical protein Q7R56_02635 [Nanoarchaeota archaeon]|nr:hypothetical protein [Nanoarchaeota archaeon]